MIEKEKWYKLKDSGKIVQAIYDQIHEHPEAVFVFYCFYNNKVTSFFTDINNLELLSEREYPELYI